MSAHPPNRIDLICPNARFEEAYAAGVVKPGHLIMLNSAGKVVVHGTSGGVHERMYALGDHLRAKTIDDAYAINDLVFYMLALPGDVILGILKAGQNVAKAARLMSAGDGTQTALTAPALATDVRDSTGVALEALDLSGGGAVDSFLRMRIV